MASLLDIFAIGFNSDGIKDFEKNLKHTETELDNAEKKVKTLETRLQELEEDGKKDTDEFKRLSAQLTIAQDDVKKFGDELKVMQNKSEYQIAALKKNFASLVKTMGLLASVGIAVKQSLQFYEQAEQLDFLAQKSNIAIESLQRLGNAAQRYGGSTEGTASTVEQFNTKEYKEKAISFGIRVTGDNPEQTLENIARKMETLKTDTQKWELAKNLGLDEGTTRLLIQGVDRYRQELKRADKYKLYTKEDIARMKDYQQIQQDIRMGVMNIQAALARFLLPALTAGAKILRSITDWLSEHEGTVKIAGMFLGIAAAISAVILAVKGLSAAFAFFAANPIVLTFLAIAAAITAVIAVIQDLIVWAEGGDSALKKWFASMGYDVERMGADLKAFFDGCIAGVKNVINWFAKLAQGVGSIAQKIKQFWDKLPEPLKKSLGFAGSALIGGVPGALAYTAGNIAAGKLKENYLIKGKETLTAANNNSLNSVSKEAISNSYQTQALTNNNNQNTKSINETNTRNAQNTVNNTKSVNVNIGSVQTQAQNGNELMREIETISDLDNGFSAA